MAPAQYILNEAHSTNDRNLSHATIFTMASDDSDTSGLSGNFAAYRGGEVIACAVIPIVVCTLFLALTFMSYRLIQRKIFFEDWLIVPSYVLMMGTCAHTICCRSTQLVSKLTLLISLGLPQLTYRLQGVKYGYVGRHLAWVEEPALPKS